MKFSKEELDMIIESLIQEKFRQILIKEDIADNFVITCKDDFRLDEREICVEGMIYVLKKDNMWYVWENYFNGEYSDIKSFKNQIDAYINAARRRYLNISLTNFEFNFDSIQDVVQSSKNFMMRAINFYGKENAKELVKKYSLLEQSENCICNNEQTVTSTIDNELVKIFTLSARKNK